MAREDRLWLSFRGTRSEAMGVRVLKLPALPAAAPRGKLAEIAGRDGALWRDDGGSETVALEALMRLGPGATREAVAAWLSGAGDLVLGDSPEFRCRARVLEAVTFARDRFGPGSLTAEVCFTCQPFRCLADEAPLPAITEAAVFPGRGTEKARPEITVHGDGDINLMVNDVTALLEDVDDHITLDCEAMMAFKDGVNASGKVTLLGGDDGDEWPTLRPEGGENRINWTGNVTKVEVQPHWRWR